MNIISALPYLDPTYTHKPVAYILKRFLKKYKIDVNSTVLHNKLSEHPYFPSLLSISDVLTSINVRNSAYKIDIDSLKENFGNPILVYLNAGAGIFCILNKIKKGRFQVVTQIGDIKWLSEKQFTEDWGGVILNLNLANEHEKPSEFPGNTYPLYLKYIIAASWGFVTFYFLQNQIPELSLSTQVLLLTNISGLSISWLLLLQHLNKNNLLVQQLCQSETKEGCSMVLNSNTAQLTSWLSMADAGVMYFSGSILVILLVKSPTLIHFLSLAAPLFSFYAIYLQAFVIKQWCRLCLAVHTFILLAFLACTLSVTSPNLILPNISELVWFLLPVLIWLFIKPFIKVLKDAQIHRYQYAAIKYNPAVFNALITQQPKISIPQSLKVFSLGDQNGANELTFVSNPFCGPCEQAHSVIEEWLKLGIDFKINFIFSHSSDKTDRRRSFVEHLSNLTDPDDLKKTLNNWFSNPNKEFAKWVDSCNLTPSDLPYEDRVLQQWLKLADVNATPTFFINGHRIPKHYRLPDLQYLISEMPSSPKLDLQLKLCDE